MIQFQMSYVMHKIIYMMIYKWDKLKMLLKCNLNKENFTFYIRMIISQ